jgi:hypothetical protein
VVRQRARKRHNELTQHALASRCTYKKGQRAPLNGTRTSAMSTRARVHKHDPANAAVERHCLRVARLVDNISSPSLCTVVPPLFSSKGNESVGGI